jgi:tetratricopeptide (TPR) repeat protein
MAPPANAKIEELRFRLKADPRSRLFFPLAEELRKTGQTDEAEQVLRTGLVAHPTYLSAWVSLGRVLREQKKDADAIDALNRALQLDPGNVVAARLLADTHLGLGDKVEAIKKYKLVHALMPGDDEVENIIASLDNELNPPVAAAKEETPPPPPQTPLHIVNPAKILEVGDEVEPIVSELDMDQRDSLRPLPASPPSLPPEDVPSKILDIGDEIEPIVTDVELPPPPPPAKKDSFFAQSPATEEKDDPFDQTMPPFAEASTRDIEPMHVAHEESPFEEPLSGYTAAAMTVEAPMGMHIEEAPPAAEVAAPVSVPESPSEPPAEDVTNTITMADLYARQGLTDDARQIYETILARDPDNDDVRAKLDGLGGGQAILPVPEEDGQAGSPVLHTPANVKVARLEGWLSKVSRKEVRDV